MLFKISWFYLSNNLIFTHCHFSTLNILNLRMPDRKSQRNAGLYVVENNYKTKLGFFVSQE